MHEASVERDDGRGGSALRAVSDAVLAIAAERSVEPVLQKIVDSARGLVRARYAALGVPDGEGGFSQFIVSGVSDATWEAIGDLPRSHGLLGLMIIAAGLESIFAYCIGCKVFAGLMRIGLVPEATCAACANVALRGA